LIVDEMTSQSFTMQRFTVVQDRCAMKVTQDACILGALAPLEDATRILDIGTGTGLLALMAAQRAPQATIVAIEPNESAALQAAENVERSPFRAAIEVSCTSLQSFSPLNSHQFDHIICNPPFYQEGSRSADEEKRAAWHAVHLTFEELAEHCVQLLTSDGLATFLCPINEIHALVSACTAHGLSMHRGIHIRDRAERPVRRVISVWSLHPGAATTEEFIVRSAPVTYSAAMLDAIQGFYLLSSQRSNE